MKDKLVNSHMIDLFANSGWKDGLVTGNSFYLKKRHYKIFCVNGNTGFKFESRIFNFIHLQNEEDYERKESSSA